MDKGDRFLGCLLGLACGDAVGTTVEFRRRGSFKPMTDMVGGGPFNLEPGQWTDDTSMALCLAESLVERDGFDPVDQLERYVRWRREGYLSSTGAYFDSGNVVDEAIEQFERTREPFCGPTEPMKSGNGSIMRLAPVAMFYHPDLDAVVHHSGESSRTTHGSQQCVEACRLFGAMLFRALSGESKEDTLLASSSAPEALHPGIQAIADGAYRNKDESEIKGSGYVVASLEAALWCFDRTDNYRDAILKAANLGDDADTTAAVCGQIAGAHYGVEGIPAEWLAKVAMRERIEELAEKLQRSGGAGAQGGWNGEGLLEAAR